MASSLETSVLQRTKVCARCGISFSPKAPGNIDRQKYCSRPCYHVAIAFTPEKAAAVFWARVNKDGPNGCWIFTGPLDKWGYGDLSYLGKHIQAHRLAWRLLRGDPGELHTLHKCHNPSCCNPDHLYLGDDRDNTRDRVEARRQAWGERARHILTANQVKRIRELKLKNRDPRKKRLAAKYGVTLGTIHAAIAGRTWKYL